MRTPNRTSTLSFSFSIALALFAAGCNAPVAVALDDGDANRVVLALDRASVDATKEPDPSTEGKFRVVVARDDVARALATMQAEELPRSKPQGVLDTVGKGSLVPSESAEQAQLNAGISGELARSLESIDGVLAARVHLAVPAKDPFGDPRTPQRPSASVLLEHRGATPPIALESVQRLVAGAVSGLAPNDVAVVAVPRAIAPQAAGPTALSHVGPIAVARGSMRVLQAALVALMAIVALLVTITLVLYSRLARARAEQSDQHGKHAKHASSA